MVTLERLCLETPPGVERSDVLFELAMTRRADPSEMIRLCDEALAEAAGDGLRSARLLAYRSFASMFAGDVAQARSSCACGAREGRERSTTQCLIAVAIARIGQADMSAAHLSEAVLERGAQHRRAIRVALGLLREPPRGAGPPADAHRSRATGPRDPRGRVLAGRGPRGRGHARTGAGQLEHLRLVGGAMECRPRASRRGARAHGADPRGARPRRNRARQVVGGDRPRTRRAGACVRTARSRCRAGDVGRLFRHRQHRCPRAHRARARQPRCRRHLPARAASIPHSRAASPILRTPCGQTPSRRSRCSATTISPPSTSRCSPPARIGSRSPDATAAAARCRALLAVTEGDLAGAVAGCEHALVGLEGFTFPFERGRIVARARVGPPPKWAKDIRSDDPRRGGCHVRRARCSAVGERRRGPSSAGSAAAGQAHRRSSPRLSYRWPHWRRVADPTRRSRLSMYLGVSTVEAHLSHVYRKLGGHRAELATRLATPPTPRPHSP